MQTTGAPPTFPWKTRERYLSDFLLNQICQEILLFWEAMHESRLLWPLQKVPHSLGIFWGIKSAAMYAIYHEEIKIYIVHRVAN